ncbi:esterase-like activity of phytase family protein [Seohaeicola zhoushanensis]
MQAKAWPALLALLAPLVGADAAAADGLRHVGTFEWKTEAVIGISGLEVAADGLSFQAVGDRGWYLSGRFQRQDGRISGLTLDRLLPILGNDGLPVAARRVGDWADAEGLAVAPDGGYWISFERWAHVARYTAPELGGPGSRTTRASGSWPTIASSRPWRCIPTARSMPFPNSPWAPGFRSTAWRRRAGASPATSLRATVFPRRRRLRG